MKRPLLSASIAAILSLGTVPQGWAALGDPSVADLLAMAAGFGSGVTTQVVDGPNDFQEVIFFSGGTEFDRFESSMPNVGSSSSSSSSVNPSYGAVADSGVEVFVSAITQNFGIPKPEAPLQFTLFDPEACDRIDELKEEISELESDIRGEVGGAKESLQDELGEVELDLRDARIKCDKFIDGGAATPASYVATNQPPSSEIAINNAINSPYTYAASLIPGAGGITGRFGFGNSNATRPWMIYAGSSFTGLDDNRTGADRRARIGEFSAGAKVRWNPKTTIGFTGGYRQGEVTSDANASKLTGEYLSATLSGDFLLKEALSLRLAASYIHGENTLEIGGGTGDFGVDVYNASASLSGAFNRKGYVIEPRLSAGISRVMRDSYTDSNAVFVPGSDITSGNVNLGASISKTLTNIEGFRSITPSVSLGGGYFFREDFDAALTSGATAEQFGLGANLAAGIDMQLGDGMGINIGGSYGLFQDNIQIWSLNAKLEKKF